jgi:hypothetical protein
MDFCTQAHSRVPNVAQDVYWFKCLGGFLRLKHTVWCQMSTSVLRPVKDTGTTFYLNPRCGQELCRLELSMGYLKRLPSNIYFFNRSWHFTRCCVLEVQNPIQTLMSVNDLGNTFDLNPKWARTLRLKFSMGYLETPHVFVLIEVDIWHPSVDLRCRNLPLVPGRVSEPQVLSWVSNVNYWGGGGFFKYPLENIRRQHSSSHGFKSKVYPMPLTDLSARAGFCTSGPQKGVKYRLRLKQIHGGSL